MRIGEIAERSGVSAKAIRYYEEVGILPVAARAPNGYREYTESTLDRLEFVRAAQACGFTLGEIRGIVAFRDRGEAPCGHVRELVDRRVAEVDRRIAELQRMRADLAVLARRARDLDPAECLPADVCHIIGPVSVGRPAVPRADHGRLGRTRRSPAARRPA